MVIVYGMEVQSTRVNLTFFLSSASEPEIGTNAPKNLGRQKPKA